MGVTLPGVAAFTCQVKYASLSMRGVSVGKKEPEPPKLGRPPMDEDEIRNCRVIVMVTKDEKEAVRRAVTAAGKKSESDWGYDLIVAALKRGR